VTRGVLNSPLLLCRTENIGCKLHPFENFFNKSLMHDGVLVGPLLKQSLLIILFLLFQADVAVMVVNATRGEFEAGFDSGGQTREHAVLVRSLGVSQLIVAVNKLDTVDWSQDRFIFIVEKLKQFLKVNIQKIDTY
jgi:hypothetical protein